MKLLQRKELGFRFLNVLTLYYRSFKHSPGWWGSVGWNVIPHTERLLVRSLFREYTQVAGWIPGQGRSVFPFYIHVFLTLSQSPFLSLSKINKDISSGEDLKKNVKHIQEEKKEN